MYVKMYVASISLNFNTNFYFKHTRKTSILI